jgi:hypothetical protein
MVKYMARHMGITQIMNPGGLEHVLEDTTLRGIAQYINSGKCKNIITMTGPGISTGM